MYIRFTHTVTSLIGNNIRVETQNNIEFEGILQTFSPQFEMVLEWVHQIDPKMPDCINHETVKEKESEIDVRQKEKNKNT